MAAWATPDRGGVPVARLDAHVEVRLLERRRLGTHRLLRRMVGLGQR
jgi:hypothetical protein